MEYVITVRKGHMSGDCRERKYRNKKRYKKAENAIDGDEDDLVLCLHMIEKRKECMNESSFHGRC